MLSFAKDVKRIYYHGYVDICRRSISIDTKNMPLCIFHNAYNCNIGRTRLLLNMFRKKKKKKKIL